MPETFSMTMFRACLGVQLIDARILPALAEHLLAEGADSPSLIQLASIGSQPYDPRDARLLAIAALGELGLPLMPPQEGGDVAAALLAATLAAKQITTREFTRLASRLVIDNDYQAGGDLMELYRTDDAWDSGWAGPKSEIDSAVRIVAERLLAHYPAIRDCRDLGDLIAALHLRR